MVAMECLPDSPLPDDLRELGYIVEQTGCGERILASAIIERFKRGARGELELLTPGSTEPVVKTRTHAGIAKVKRYRFDVP